MKILQPYIFVVITSLFIFSCTPRASQDMQGTAPEATSSGNGDWRATAPEPAPAPEFKLGDYKDFKLGNGLNVIVVENHKLPVVSYQLFVDRGPLKEGDIAGISSITVQMPRPGTENKTKAEIDETLASLAAQFQTTSSG